MRNLIFLGAVISCTLYSCVKAPSYSIIPHIEFVSVSSSFIPNGKTDTITFSFTDGDGDIAHAGSDQNTPLPACCSDTCSYPSNFNIFLIDNRGNKCIYYFQSPDLRPAGKYKDISGNMQVLQAIYTSKCFACASDCKTQNNYALDTVIYSIVIRDLAGHFSDTIQTTPILTSCSP